MVAQGAGFGGDCDAKCEEYKDQLQLKKKKDKDEDGSTDPVVDDPLIWSTGNYTNQFLGDLFSFLSIKLQHGANFFSYLGALSEIGFTTAGLLFGAGAVGWIDLGLPIADVSGGLAGGLVGWEQGHAIHVLFTNPIESGLSNASTFTSALSDLALGNNRLDIYSSHVTGVIGQSTATSLALTFVGDLSTTGIADAAIDQVGSWYSDGKIGGVYDLFGITGTSIPIASSPSGSFVSIQFGDR